MIIEGRTIKLTTSELIEYGLTESVIKKGLYRNRKFNLKSWRHCPHPEDRRIKLIDYDSLPEGTKKKIPAKSELLKISNANSTEDRLNAYQDSIDQLPSLHLNRFTDILDFHYSMKVVTNKVKAMDVMHAAGWLRLLNNYRSKSDTRSIGFESKADLRKAVLNEILTNAKQDKGHLYGFKVSDITVLQKKELAWRKAIQTAFEEHSNLTKTDLEEKIREYALETVIPNHYGNRRAQVIGKQEGENDILIQGGINISEWNAKNILYLYMNPGGANKFDIEEVYRRYSKRCKEENKEAVSLSAVKRFLSLDSVKQYTTWERDGFSEFDKLIPHIKGKRPDYSLNKGGYDGFQVDFYTKVQQGNAAKRMMLTVVAVFDYHSGAITGYDVGLVENGLMVRNMFRNHLKLSGGRSYIEIESDRFSGNLTHDTKSIFEQTCQHITQPTPNDPHGHSSNPKARFVERLIQEFNRLTQNVPGWKGTNITGIDKQRKPNYDYMAGHVVESYEEAVTQIIKLVNVYNNVKLERFNNKSRIQQFESNINPQSPTIPQESIALLLNQNTTTTVRNGVISITVNKRDYEYNFPEYSEFLHLMEKGRKVHVYYDETSMETVDVFGKKDQHIATLGKLNRVARDKAGQTKQDLEEIGRTERHRETVVEDVDRKVLEMEASMYNIDISNLPLKDAYELVAGAREQQKDEILEPVEVRFEEELSTENAMQSKAYYEDVLLRTNGMQVPTKADKSKEGKRREYYRQKNDE